MAAARDRLVTANPAEVVLTSRGSATTQRVLAGASIIGAAALGVAIALSDLPWWGIALAELGVLVVVLIMMAIGASASDNARETTALRATGRTVVADVLDSEAQDDGETTSHRLTLWIPVDGGFEVGHWCHHYGGEQQLQVLVDPATRVWGVMH
ncbi:hypothetical protein BBK82_39015 [Lentzea guizhouensis]|uniref:Uncharacterized protein n=1 Tax=Lentzea guizhouensis TaxID=1586287 RepID=A0A1B2HTM7_9PSEU|nr:hypothetical protein [Lentzea guizhouensis]ANZ41089.1 hypothetical protein BBK82_39015 [Lentzea guizhouensis]